MGFHLLSEVEMLAVVILEDQRGPTALLVTALRRAHHTRSPLEIKEEAGNLRGHRPGPCRKPAVDLVTANGQAPVPASDRGRRSEGRTRRC